MALVYPGSAAIPRYESSLAAFMPAFEAGQKERRDADAFDAAAKAFGGPGATQQPQSALERLVGLFGGGQQQGGPYTRPESEWAPTPTNIPEDSWETIASIPTTPSTAAAAIDSVVPQGYRANARAAESGGNDMAANPNSSALGRYQFLEGTWNGLMQQYPELGLTADGRTDPAQQERAMAQFTQDNARALANAGIPVNPGTLYAAHFLGAGGARQALTADPATPMTALVDPGVIEANPQLAQMTAGDFAQWAQGKGGNPNGGYRPPMLDVGAGQGTPFQVDEGTMRTLLASEATRPLAISLIQAQQQAQASQGRYVTEQGANGAVFQRDTLTGETKVILTPDQAKLGGDETFFGNPVPYQDADGNIQFGQIGNKGTFKPIDLGDGGGQFVSPTKTVNTETEQIVMDQFGNVLSRIPINNREAAFETGFGSAAGKAAAERIDSLPQTIATADNMIGTIDGILNDPALEVSTGWLSWMQGVPGTDQYRFGQRALQLQGQAFLQAFESLKGGGQITEVEGSKATQAIGRLSTAQSAEDYRDALNELKDIINAAKARAEQRAGSPAGTETTSAPSDATRLVYNPVTGELE